MGLVKTELFSTPENEIALLADAIGHPAPVSILSHLFEISRRVCGLKKEDFMIDLDHNILTISSEKKVEKEEKEGEKVTRREFSYSSFQRSFQLPDNVKKEDISAEYVDGLLKLTLPKLESPKLESRKQIDIK